VDCGSLVTNLNPRFPVIFNRILCKVNVPKRTIVPK
jgi:hypothetical protein